MEQALKEEEYDLVPCRELGYACKGEVMIKVKKGTRTPLFLPPGVQRNFTPPKGSTLTVVEKLYYQQAGEQPTPFSNQYSLPSTVSEQAWLRNAVVGQEWQAPDLGWVKTAAAVIVHNREGTARFVNPTDEEKVATLAKIVEVGIAVGDTVVASDLVKPGTHIRKCCAFDLKDLRLRCRSGEAKVTFILFPG